jgi:hypothetical protein
MALSLSRAVAGDPIQFSGDKAKPAPGGVETRPVDNDVFKGWNKSKGSVSAPLNPLTPFITPGRSMDSKQERRLKNVREERKNWMLLEPGELQKREEQEEDEFGGRGLAIDDFDDQETSNYLFHNVTQDNKPRNAPVRNHAREADDETPKKDTRSLSIFGPRETEKAGAHTASELNLKGLIDTSQGGPHLNKNEASLFQFLKDNSPAVSDRDQQSRRDSFRNFINGGPPSGPAPSGLSDPINFRTDLTQERMNPIMPNRPSFDLPSTAPSKAPDSFLTRQPAGFTPGRAQGLPEMVSPAQRQPMGPHVPSPLLMQDEPRTRASVMGSGSLFNREAPRRGGI